MNVYLLYARVQRHLIRANVTILLGVVRLYTEPIKVPLCVAFLALLWFLRKRTQGVL